MNSYKKNLFELKDKHHKYCIFNINDFKINSFFDNDGVLTLELYCNDNYQSYNGIIHGGVLSALIDSAMTQCLFGHGIVGYTVRLNIKYIKPVNINKKFRIIVNIEEKYPMFSELNAYIIQDERKKVKANSKFWTQYDNKEVCCGA